MDNDEEESVDDDDSPMSEFLSLSKALSCSRSELSNELLLLLLQLPLSASLSTVAQEVLPFPGTNSRALASRW